MVIRKRRNNIPILQMRILRLRECNLVQLHSGTFASAYFNHSCLGYGEEAEQTSLRRLGWHKNLRHQHSYQHGPILHRDEHQIYWIEGRER